MSVAEIKNEQIYDYETMLPLEGGLNDSRMGTSSFRHTCLTCNGNSFECPGHFGHIELVKPVYHIGTIDIVKKVLSCVCYNCSKLLLPKDSNEYQRIQKIKNPKARMREMVKACSSKSICVDITQNDENQEIQIDQDSLEKKRGCGSSQPKYLLDKLMIKISKRSGDRLKQGTNNEDEQERNETERDDAGRDFFAEQALEILKKISDIDVEMIGLNPKTARPEQFIFTVLPIAPPQVRPSIQMDSSARSEDDLTHQYKCILKINSEIKRCEERGMPASQIEERIYILQIYVATLINNEISGIAQAKLKSGKPIKSIRERLKGKEGRLRKNLMGKRVDFSARTVVSPDSNLALDELGVPRSIAINLTFPETVTPLNIERLKKLVENGPTEWPGAKSIIRKDGVMFDLRYVKNRSDVQLDYGFIVERHIFNGDYVVFNRQPTLHRMSMMGHRVRILPFSSFRLNLSVTTPYNADFDGDEMNMHVPQSYESKSEIKNIMHVPRQIVSPQANKPVMGIVQDSLLGVRKLTKRNTFLTKDDVMQLLMWVDDFEGSLPQPAILKPKPLWTGKQIISMVIPKLNLEKKCNVYSDLDDHNLHLKDGKVIIEQGELLCGMLDKGVVGSSPAGLLHFVYLDYGPYKAADLLTNIQRIVNNWLVIHGFSVGCSDIFPDQESKIAVQNDLKKADLIVGELLALAEKKKLDHQPGKKMIDSFEANVNSHLNTIFDEASQKAQKMMNDDNNIYNMVAAGSKGSNLNIAQIMACVGQQNVEGKRIPYGFNKRTLPHFTKDDYGSKSRGFVKNSYLTGLSPDEFFFHAMGGREGLIDTAVKTSETGYLQRRLIKCLEDVMVKYDSTVRDCTGNVIQFFYGEDGMAGEYIEGFMQPYTDMKDDDFNREFRFFDPEDIRDVSDQLGQYENDFSEDVLNNLLSYPEALNELRKEFLGLKELRNELRLYIDSKIYLPVNIPRLLKNIKSSHKITENHKTTLNPVEVIKRVKETISKLIIVSANDNVRKEAEAYGTFLLTSMIRFYLSSKRVCLKENLSLEVFEEVLGEIEKKFTTSKVQPGEMIGIICAQSLGEPTTQMTLNTFHFAGVSAKNVTLGVPRLKEILNVAKNIKTPSMQIYMKPGLNSSLEEGEVSAKMLQSMLEYTTLGFLTNVVEVYYDPDQLSTVIEEDKAMVDLYRIMSDEESYISDCERASEWLLRFELDKNTLIDRHFQRLEEIAVKINTHLQNRLMILYNSDFIPEVPALRIRLRDVIGIDNNQQISSQEQLETLNAIKQKLLDELRLKGVPNIRKVFLRKYKRKEFTNTGQKKEIQEWMLETDGSSLRTVLSINEVDHRKTTTNHVSEILDVLGIEAARLSIIKEFKLVLDVYGIYVNYRHLATLSDTMTHRGKIDSISRHGINQVVEGPFRRASFEQTVEILFQAGMFSEEQNFMGITENIMYGQLCPLGTGSFDVMMDFEKLSNPRYMPELSIINEMEPEAEIFEDGHFRKTNNLGTPEHIRTPGPGGMTPGMSVRSTHYDGAFTPYTPTRGMESPVYYKAQNTPVEGISPGIQSPMYFGRNFASPAYNRSSPIYSPNVSYASPKYSPGSNILSHSPMSPSYNAHSASPSYSGGTLKPYSPASPSYQNYLSSPRYTQGSHSQSRSPASPNYGSPMSGGSLSSQNLGTHQYSPNSPAYNIASGNYNPKSPAYNVSANAYLNANEKNPVYSEEEDEEDEN